MAYYMQYKVYVIRAAFRLKRLAQTGGLERLLSLWHCVHFRTWWSLFNGSCKGILMFWWFEVGLSWQVQEIGAVLF